MTDSSAPPRPRLADCRHVAALEVESICERLRDLERSLVESRGPEARPAADTAPRRAELGRVEAESEDAVGRLGDARRVVEALLRLGFC